MADPTPYTRGYSFSDYQTANPTRPLPGVQVDNELENVEQSTAELVSAIKDVRRADGKLKNGVVTRDSLGEGISVPIGVIPPGTVDTAALADQAVTNAKAADMPGGTIKMRPAGAAGSPIDGTPAQARALVQVIDTTPSLLINGAMQYSQELDYLPAVLTGASVWPYPADQFYAAAAGTGISVRVARLAVQAGVTPLTPGGSANRVQLRVDAAKPTLAAGDFLMFQQAIEAQALAGTRFGTAGARRLLGSFMFRGPAGTYGWRFTNDTATRVWIGTFTITALQANTDTVQTISVDPETTGTWSLSGSNHGASFSVVLACGSDRFGVAGWNSSAKMSTPAQTNGLATFFNIFEVGDFDLYPDYSGIGAVRPFMAPDPNFELSRCQRYFWKRDLTPGSYANPINTSNVFRSIRVQLPVEMRTVPRCTFTTAVFGTFGAGYPALDGLSRHGANIRMDMSAADQHAQLVNFTASARL